MYETLPDGRERLARTFTASAWTPEDRALMLAWRRYTATLCSGCGEPKDRAWHPDMDGWYEAEHVFTCWSCTARRALDTPDGQRVEPVTYPVFVDTRDHKARPLPPFDLDDPSLHP